MISDDDALYETKDPSPPLVDFLSFCGCFNFRRLSIEKSPTPKTIMTTPPTISPAIASVWSVELDLDMAEAETALVKLVDEEEGEVALLAGISVVVKVEIGLKEAAEEKLVWLVDEKEREDTLVAGTYVVVEVEIGSSDVTEINGNSAAEDFTFVATPSTRNAPFLFSQQRSPRVPFPQQ